MRMSARVSGAEGRGRVHEVVCADADSACWCAGVGSRGYFATYERQRGKVKIQLKKKRVKVSGWRWRTSGGCALVRWQGGTVLTAA